MGEHYTGSPNNAIITTQLGRKKTEEDIIGGSSLKESRKNPIFESFNWGDLGKNNYSDPKNRIPKSTYKLSKNISIYPPPNQGCCGCCWAVSTVTALSDRFSIQGDMKNPYLSWMPVLQCCTGGSQYGIIAGAAKGSKKLNCSVMSSENKIGKCFGGFPAAAAEELSISGSGTTTTINKKGKPSYNLQPKQFNKHNNKCFQEKCLNSFIPVCDENIYDLKNITLKKYHSDDNYSYIQLNYTKANDIVKSIKKNLIDGPIVCGFSVLGDFGLANIKKKRDWSSTGNIYIPPMSSKGNYDDIWGTIKTQVSNFVEIGVNNDDGDLRYNFNMTKAKKKPQPNFLSCPPRENFSDPCITPSKCMLGFHCVCIIGYGMYTGEIKNNTVKDFMNKYKSKFASLKGIPFWVCRNSWGPEWKISNSSQIKTSKGLLNIPDGCWLHAAYPFNSLGMDFSLLASSKIEKPKFDISMFAQNKNQPKISKTYYGCTTIINPHLHDKVENFTQENKKTNVFFYFCLSLIIILFLVIICLIFMT